MKALWQLQEAKNRFSDVVDEALAPARGRPATEGMPARIRLRRQEGRTALRDRLEQGPLVVKGSGKYRQIYDRWLGRYEPPPAIAFPARRFLRPSLTIGVSLSAQRGRREAGAFLAGL